MYKYDLHVHTNIGSLCSQSTPEEMVEAYFNAGYSGIVITDHFISGCTRVTGDIHWKEQIETYYSACDKARKKAKELGEFSVFFGGEYCYADGHEILILGAEKEFLINHPEINNMELENLCDLLKENGCLLIKAHPYRIRPYNDTSIPMENYTVDGIEVYNSCNNQEENKNAFLFAQKANKIMTSGGDMHNATDDRIGLAGIAVSKPIKTAKQLISALKKGSYNLIVDGEIKTLP